MGKVKNWLSRFTWTHSALITVTVFTTFWFVFKAGQYTSSKVPSGLAGTNGTGCRDNTLKLDIHKVSSKLSINCH